ncbi:sporulation protein Cse60 [Streptococcus salivarius]|jgi:hypothetical protein|uniref:sporulation protein Cse60 n=1 Tax=Streptococcus salivarius TaxID=1304 RepID=UPI001BD982B7|nr:sporulation protein Cse60 [Streptococcus salivarius]
MIKTHEIVTSDRDRPYKRIDDLIGEFLSRHKNIDLVDIKYQVNTYKVGYDIVHRTSTLIIYKWR